MVHQVGQYVAKLSILLADSEKEVGRQARGILHRLFQLLLCQRGTDDGKAGPASLVCKWWGPK